jgi:cell division septation protein DedD
MPKASIERGIEQTMTHSPTQTPSLARFGLALMLLAGLGACSETFQPFGNLGTRNASADGPAPIGATRLVERDVEAPEIFQVTEEGLWDGRPSLGGVWVAHPTADDPERVIIRNTENGRFVIGALFRREREQPGPELMVSSDAAAALNVLAGDPTELQVTALRREEVADPEADSAGEPDLTFAAAETADAATPTEITAAPLDDPIAAAAAAIEESERGAASPAVQTAAATPTAASPAPTPPASALDRPFVQIGIFSVQENANNTGQALRNAGLVPTIYDQTSNDRRFWRVVVGPAQTAADRAAILETVQGLGFEDAYFVRR